jgi:hypothetical protein
MVASGGTHDPTVTVNGALVLEQPKASVTVTV